MQVSILGPVRVGPAGEVPGAGVRALLARLALAPGRVVGVETIVEDLWGTRRPANAVNAVQAAASRLRKALNGYAVTVEAAAGGYRLAVARDDVDATVADVLLASATAALRDGDPAAAAAEAGRALELWRGEPLADVGDAPFATVEAARLGTLRLGLRRARIEADLRRGAHADLPAELAALVDDHPLDEVLLAQLMRALVATGRPAEALAAYEDGRARLAEAFGADPGPQLRDVHLAVLTHDRPALRLGQAVAQPANPADPVTPGGGPRLRRPATPLLGRDDDLAAVERSFETARLVTLLGPGGVGKTRLATEIALRRRDRTGSAVHVVELAGLRSGDDVLPAVLAALGIRELDLTDRSAHPAAHAPLDRLLAALAGHDGLIVMDNCEHVVDAAAAVVHEIVTSSTRVRVLATSRTPLAVDGETVQPVPALAMPPDRAPADPLDYPAVRLFHDRARAARPAARLGPAVVIDICRHLDGLPLAIELAAAKVRTMSVEQIAARLDDRFGLLVDGARSAPPRHRTLLAVVRWSWELLTETEQAVLRRLSVLPGGASAESAPQVCGFGAVAGSGVEAALTALADQSLLVVDESAGAVRFRMLETVREFADAELDRAGDRAGATAGLVSWAVRLATRAVPELRGRTQVAWVRRLARDHDNLVAALRAAIDADDARAAYAIAAALCWYWAVLGLHSEVAAWGAQVCAMDGAADDHTEALLCAVVLPNQLIAGPSRAAARTMHRLRRLVRSSTRLDPVTRALGGLMLATMGERPEPARQARAAVEATGDRWLQAMSAVFDSFRADNEGAPEESRRLARRAYDGFAEIGDRWGVAMVSMSLGMNEAARGDGATAVRLLDEAVSGFQALGASADGRQVQLLRGIVRIRAGSAEHGARELLDLLAGHPQDAEVVMLASTGLGEAAARRGDAAQMLSRYDDAVAAARSGFAVGPPQLHAMALVGAAVARLRAGRDGAEELLADAFDRAAGDADRPVIGLVAVAYGRLAVARGDAGRAARLIALGRRLGALEFLTEVVRPPLAELPDPDERLLGPERDRARGLDIAAVVAELTALVRLGAGRPAR